MAPKKKQEKMNLGEFLTNQSLGSWADEMDSQPIPAASSGTGYSARDRDGGERRAFTQPQWESARTGSGFGGGAGGGMGGRGASYDRPRFAEREQLPLPTKPPYTAHLGNLTYDVTQADIEDFLKDCQVTNVRIVEDKLDHKPKGFGYVEFETLEGLKKALTLTETNFMGRNVKISVAEPPKGAESTRDFSDWSRKGPLPEAPQSTRQPSNRGFNRNFDNMSDAGSERGGSRKPGFFEGDGKSRDFSNWERKGPLSPAPNAGPPVRDSGRLREGGSAAAPAGPGQQQRQAPAWGEGRSDAGSRPPRREFEARPIAERVPTAAEMDNQWRTGMRADPSPAPTPTVSVPSSPQPEAPKERPKLNLKQRTVSTATTEPASASASDSKSSPFGAARPIDTATKEREIEEKRQLALRQKKEADDKSKEEKQAREAATRAARGDRADRGQAQEDDKVTSPTGENGNKGRRSSRQQNGVKSAPKENGEAPVQSRPNFSILRREEEEEAAGADEDGNANGDIVDDKNIKPQEVTQEVSTEAGSADASTENTAEVLEEEGWSTVGSSNKKNARRGGARALAS